MLDGLPYVEIQASAVRPSEPGSREPARKERRCGRRRSIGHVTRPRSGCRSGTRCRRPSAPAAEVVPSRSRSGEQRSRRRFAARQWTPSAGRSASADRVSAIGSASSRLAAPPRSSPSRPPSVVHPRVPRPSWRRSGAALRTDGEVSIRREDLNSCARGFAILPFVKSTSHQRSARSSPTRTPVRIGTMRSARWSPQSRFVIHDPLHISQEICIDPYR